MARTRTAAKEAAPALQIDALPSPPPTADAELQAVLPRAAGPTKLDRLVELLKRPEGATIAQMQAVTGWQPHSVRGALAGALKARLCVTIASRKEPHGRVYRISPQVEA